MVCVHKDVQGKPAIVIKSNESIFQECIWSMFFYGLGQIPLRKKMGRIVKNALKSWYADIDETVGTA